MNAFRASGPAAHIPDMPPSRRDTYVDPIDKRWSAWLPAEVPGMHCKGLSDTVIPSGSTKIPGPLRFCGWKLEETTAYWLFLFSRCKSVCAKYPFDGLPAELKEWETVTCDDCGVHPAARAVPIQAVGGGSVGRWYTVVGVGGGRSIGQSTKVDVNVR